MSTFDFETPEEVWPVGTRKTVVTVKKELLQMKKKAIEETTKLNLPLNKLILSTENSIFSAHSIQFLEKTFDAQFNNTARRKKTRGVDSKRCMKLEGLLSKLLRVILKDTIQSEQQHQLDGMHQELVQLFDNLIETQSEDSTAVGYSPRLKSVLSRIAETGLVTLDSSNNTVEFEF